MSDDQPNGPPKEDGPGTSTGTTNTTADQQADTDQPTSRPRQRCVADQLRRRRAAAQRLEHGDPWHPWRPDRLSPVHLDAAAAACEHLQELDCVPIVPTTVARQLWAAGHRELAVSVGRST